MHALSPPEIALHLGNLYGRAVLGFAPNALHRELADFLGCHPEMQAAAWDLWCAELALTGHDPDAPGAWLDYGFYDAVPVE